MAKKKTVTPTAKKLKKRDYVLIDSQMIGDKFYKKGDKVSLTVEGARYFRQIHKIK